MKRAALLLMVASVFSFGGPREPDADQLAQDRRPSATTSGEIRAIQREAEQITVDHGALLTLNLPAATRGFPVRDRGLLDGIRVGDTIWFTVEDINGQLTITRVDTKPDEHGDH